MASKFDNLHPNIKAMIEDNLKYPICRAINTSKKFFVFQFILVVISFLIPVIFSFYDQPKDFDRVSLAINCVAVPLVFIHSIINIIITLDNLNPPESKGCSYVLFWCVYEIIKIGLAVAQLSAASTYNSNNIKLISIVLVFLLLEGIHFFISEFQVPKKIFNIIVKSSSKILWVLFTKLIVTWFFSFLGYFLYKSCVEDAYLNGNTWIEGDEFDNFLQSYITLLDINDWYNAGLIRVVDECVPLSSTYFFVTYVIMSRYIIDGILVALIVECFVDTQKITFNKGENQI